jgi:hypothetical protein
MPLQKFECEDKDSCKFYFVRPKRQNQNQSQAIQFQCSNDYNLLKNGVSKEQYYFT